MDGAAGPTENRPANTRRRAWKLGSYESSESSWRPASLSGRMRSTNFIVGAPTRSSRKPSPKKPNASAASWRSNGSAARFPSGTLLARSPCKTATTSARRSHELQLRPGRSLRLEDGHPGGSRERVLDSVLPHEVNHTIFATYFRRPLPRWADEGACTTVEHFSERQKQQTLLIKFLKTERGIPFSSMFVMKEYPATCCPSTRKATR